jgi:hypothetical protein
MHTHTHTHLPREAKTSTPTYTSDTPREKERVAKKRESLRELFACTDSLYMQFGS